MALLAKNVMTDSVISVSPEASLLDALRIFVDEGIHGAPVVSEDGKLKGVVTTMDLLRAQEDELGTAIASNDYLRELLEFSSPDWSGDLVDFQDRLSERRVSEVMTRSVLTVSPDSPVKDVARCLREHGVHRVWVESAGELRGVISTLDLMPVIESASS